MTVAAAFAQVRARLDALDGAPLGDVTAALFDGLLDPAEIAVSELACYSVLNQVLAAFRDDDLDRAGRVIVEYGAALSLAAKSRGTLAGMSPTMN